MSYYNRRPATNPALVTGIAFIAAVAGAGVALLLAPKKGTDLRKDIAIRVDEAKIKAAKKAEEAKDKIHHKSDEVKDAADDKMDQAKSKASDAATDTRDTVKKMADQAKEAADEADRKLQQKLK
jgi:gas vesicle protein